MRFHALYACTVLLVEKAWGFTSLFNDFYNVAGLNINASSHSLRDDPAISICPFKSGLNYRVRVFPKNKMRHRFDMFIR